MTHKGGGAPIAAGLASPAQQSTNL